MLVVKIELWPHGHESLAEEIARGYIANDGTGTPTKGNYQFLFTANERSGEGDSPPFYPDEKKVRKAMRATIEGFPRQRQGAWDLLREGLSQLYEQPRKSKKVAPYWWEYQYEDSGNRSEKPV